MVTVMPLMYLIKSHVIATKQFPAKLTLLGHKHFLKKKPPKCNNIEEDNQTSWECSR